MTRRKTSATPAGVARSRARLTRRERRLRRWWVVRLWAEWDKYHQYDEQKEQR
jgi:hypothetical protein